MKQKDIEKYLEKSRDFWNVPDVKIAMYRRIFTDFSKEFKDLDFDELLRKWNKSIDVDLKKIFSNVPDNPEWKILEIGCGIGRLIKPLREKYNQVDGVDISQKMVEFSQEYLGDGGKNGNIYLNDGMSLSMLKDNHYDFVYSMVTFQHIRSYSVVQSYLREIIRILKSGGYFKLQILKPSDGMGVFNEEGEVDKDYRFFGNAYSEQELRTILADSGLEVVEVIQDSDQDLWLWANSRKK